MASMDLDADLVELAPWVPPPSTPGLREVAFSARSWLPDEIETLRRLFLADAGLDEMAAAVGRPRQGVRAKICELGLRRNSLRPWSEWEDAELVARYPFETAARLGQDLGRTPGAVYARAGMLRLMEDAALPYDAWEDAQIAAGYAAGVPTSQIAALIGRPLKGLVTHAWRTLGVRHSAAPVAWSDDESARALELAAEGLPYAAIVELLAGEGFPRRSARGFGLQVRKMGYGRGWGRPWGAEEDALLRDAYARGESLTPLRDRMGRSMCSIRWRVGELGLRGTHPNKNGFRQGDDWTPEQDARLREAYGKMRAKDLARELGRKLGGVYNRAHALKLDSGWARDFSADEDRALAVAWRTGVGLTDLALAMGRDVAVVHKRAVRIGLSFSDPARPVKAKRTPRAKRPTLTLGDILALDDQAAA